GVVGRKVRAAGQAEYDLDTLRLQAFHESVGRSHLRSPPFRLFRGTSGALLGRRARRASRASVPTVFRRSGRWASVRTPAAEASPTRTPARHPGTRARPR